MQPLLKNLGSRIKKVWRELWRSSYFA